MKTVVFGRTGRLEHQAVAPGAIPTSRVGTRGTSNPGAEPSWVHAKTKGRGLSPEDQGPGGVRDHSMSDSLKEWSLPVPGHVAGWLSGLSVWIQTEPNGLRRGGGRCGLGVVTSHPLRQE